MSYIYRLDLDGYSLECSFRYPETAAYFGSYVTPLEKSQGTVFLSDSEWELWYETDKPLDAFAEYSLFSGVVSAALLPQGACILHAAALRFADKAWLICGLPGTGKSTQARYLFQTYPELFSVISGDRPLILKKDEKMYAAPSPWNGKENWKGAPEAEIGGIILLSRGETNQVLPCKTKDAVLPLFQAVFHTAETGDVLRQAASITEQLLKSVPCWSMTSFSVPESSRLLYQTIFKGQL